MAVKIVILIDSHSLWYKNVVNFMLFRTVLFLKLYPKLVTYARAKRVSDRLRFYHQNFKIRREEDPDEKHDATSRSDVNIAFSFH